MKYSQGEDKTKTLLRTPFEIAVGVRYIGTKDDVVKESGIAP